MVESRTKVKLVFVMIDGLSDLTYQSIDCTILINSCLVQTPMQKAQIPTMNALAKSGICGLHDPVQSSLSCGSDTAHMSIFGYDPLKLYKYG